MPENIELKYCVMHRIKVKMCSSCAAGKLICRMLYRCKFKDIHFFGHNNNTARMLACCTLDTDKSKGSSSKFCLTCCCSCFFLYFTDNCYSIFISKTTYRSCAESVALPEQFRYIFMSF